MIVVDTGPMLALLDRDDRIHETVLRMHEEQGNLWILPWAILPEVDYLAAKYLGRRVADAFIEDLRDGRFRVDANVSRDMPRATQLVSRYRDLELGLVDAVVMAQAEHWKAQVVMTTDLRHFGTVKLDLFPMPRLFPRDR